MHFLAQDLTYHILDARFQHLRATGDTIFIPLRNTECAVNTPSNTQCVLVRTYLVFPIDMAFNQGFCEPVTTYSDE